MRTRWLLVLLGSMAVTLPGLAQDEAASPPAAPPAPADAPGDTRPPAPEGQEGEQSADDGNDASSDIDEFIFSEEIPADEQLVFPVDI